MSSVGDVVTVCIDSPASVEIYWRDPEKGKFSFRIARKDMSEREIKLSIREIMPNLKSGYQLALVYSE